MIIYEEIFREFQRQKVKYVLVGGIAFNLLGGDRLTRDMDILVKMTKNNLLKVVRILKEQGYFVKQPVNPEEIADSKTRKSWVKEKHMKAFNFYKDAVGFEEVDIVIDSPMTYEKAIRNAKKAKLEGLEIPIISIGGLIKMKKNTKRDKDKMDVKQLLLIKKLKNEKKHKK